MIALLPTLALALLGAAAAPAANPPAAPPEPASAPASRSPLVDALRERQARLDAILARHPGDLPTAAREELGKALASLIDFRIMGRAALGPSWEQRSEAERKEYLQAFEELVRANSLRRIDIYRADAIDYVAEKVAGDEGAVKTTVKTKNATTEVVYTFRRGDGRWRVVDYTIDGVSAVRNYQAQFSKILDKRGFQGLVERLRKRRAEIEAGKES